MTQPTGHRIEETVLVYLTSDDTGTGWNIDRVTVDGAPLDSHLDGPGTSECECDDRAACNAAANALAEIPLPNARELRDMLTAALNERN